MKTWLRRIAMGIGIVVLIALLLPLMAIVALQHNQVRSIAVDRVLSEVNEDLAGTVSVDRVEGSLVGHARLKDIHITDARGNHAAQIDTATVDFRLLPLLRGTIIVDHLAVDGANAVARTYEDQVFNWDLVLDPEPDPTPEEPFDWPIYVDDISFDGIDVAYLDESAEVDDEADGLSDWRQARIDDLDEATDGDELRHRWEEGFQSDQLDELAGPRAPIALWLTSVEAHGVFRMKGFDMEAEVPTLSASLHSDIFSRSLSTSIADLFFEMGESTLHIDIKELELDQWLRGREFTAAILLPPQDGAPAEEDEEGFQSMVIDLGQWQADAPLFEWAAPEAPLTAPVELGGRLALDPQDLTVDARIQRAEAPSPLETTVFLEGYAEDVPEYRASVRAPDFHVSHWIDDPDLPELTTSAVAYVEGQGFEPDELVADLRLRLDDTTADDYEADLIYAAVDFDGERLQGQQIAALTPYFDINAAFELDLDGHASLQARTTAEEHHGAGVHFADYRPDHADLSIDLETSFDPELVVGDDPLRAVETITGSASWDVAGLEIEDISAAQSEGRIFVDARQLPNDGSPTLAANYEVEATGRTMVFQDQRVGFFSIEDTGRLTVSPLADDPFDAIVALENDATATVRHLHTPGLQLSRATVRMETSDVGAPSRAADLTLDATVAGVHTADADVDDLEARLDGVLRFGSAHSPLDALDADISAQASGLSSHDASVDAIDIHLDDTQVVFGADQPPVQSLSTHLRADASGLNSSVVRAETLEDVDAELSLELGAGAEPMEMLRHLVIDAQAALVNIEMPEHNGAIERIDLRADLDGPFDAPRGVVGAEALALSIADEHFPQAGAEVTVDGDLRRGRAAAQLRRNEDEGYHLQTKFDFEPGYEAAGLSDMRLGTDRISWRSPSDAVIRWTGARVEADDFSLRSDDQLIAVDGYFHPDMDQNLVLELDIDLEETIYGFYLEPLLPPIEGEFQGSAQLAGTHNAPTVESELQLADIYYDGVGPVSMEARTGYEGDILSLHRLDITAFDEPLVEASARLPMTFDLDGEFEIFTQRHSELRLRLHEQRLRQFHRPFPVLNDFGVDGQARMYLEWAGTLDDPRIDLNAHLRDFQFQGEVGEDFIDIRDMTLESELEYVSVQQGGQGLHFATDVVWNDDDVLDFDVHTPLLLEDWLVAFAEGDADTLEWDDEFLHLPFDIRLVLPSFDLDRIPLEGFEELEGHVDIDAHMEGPLQELEGHFDLMVDGFGWPPEIAGRPHQLSDINLDLRLAIEDQSLDVDTMELMWMGRHVSSAEGTVPLPIPTLLAGEPLRDLPVDFHWVFHDRDIRDFDVINFDLYGHIMHGYVGAELEMGGSLRDPELFARAGVYETRMGDDNMGSFEVQVGASDNQVEIDGELIREEIPVVTVDGHAPVLLDALRLSRGEDWQLPGEIHLDISADEVELADVLPSHLLAQYVVDAEGLLTLDVDIGGDWESPTVDGVVELEDGAATLPQFARGFENIHTRFELGADAFVLDHFEIHDGPSSLEASGVITHDLLIPDEIDLGAEADDFNLIGIGTDFPVFASGEILTSGQLLGDPGELEVDIYNLEVVLTDEWDRTLHATDLDPDIVILDDDHRARIAEMADEEADEIDGLHLSVDITVHPRAIGRHPAGDVTFDADLTAEVIGTVVIIGGTVDVRDGEVEFLGRNFLLQPSEVTFTGEIPPNPRLNLEAHYELERVIVDALGPPTTGEPRVEFHISGTSIEPRLQLEADPAMTDTEILFVLMTGRPPDRTGIGRDEGVAAQALSAVSGVFLGLLEDELAGTVPVDVLRLEPAVPGTRGGRLEVGRYLLPELFFSWRHQFGADEDVAGNIWRLEYHFRPRWMLEGRYTDLNEGEFNIFWDAF